MAHCPAYQRPICSLCCTLDARCGDLCKPHRGPSAQWLALLRRLLPRAWWPQLDTGLAHYLLLMAWWRRRWRCCAGAVYTAGELRTLGEQARAGRAALRQGFVKAYARCCWWPASSPGGWCWRRQPPRGAGGEQPPDRALVREIESHRRTDEALQQAKHARRPSRQPGQDALHQRHQPRAAHAAQQHPGLCAAAGRGPHDAAAPQAGGAA
jgi:hypothetical protein